MNVDDDHDGSIDSETLQRMVTTIAPDWTVQRARAAEDGIHHVHYLDVETPTGSREWVLKATPEGEPALNDAEARVVAVLDANSSIPVPEVYGVVDDCEDLPAPYFLMERLPGETIRRTELDGLDTDTVGWIAAALGRELGRLHRIDAVDGFGVVVTSPDSRLDGDAPSGDPGDLAVADPVEDWPAYVRQSAEDALSGMESTEFADLVPDVRSAVEELLADLSGPFRPGLGGIDYQIANVRLDRSDRSLTGLIDWGFTLSVVPAYDLTFAVRSLAGGPWWYVNSTPDYRESIRDRLIEGYRETGPEDAVASYRTDRELYELLAVAHSTNHFADRLALDGATDEEIASAADRHREILERRC